VSSWWQDLSTRYPHLSSWGIGIFLAAAYPPISLPGPQILAWPLLWHLAKTKKPFWRLYQALLSWNLFTTYWLCLTALSAPNLTEAAVSFLAGAVTILTNPLLMTIPFLLWRKIPLPQANYLFIPLWVGFEYLHFRWELSWGWLTLGFSWSEWPFFGHLAGIGGPLGLSAWTLLAAALLTTRPLSPTLRYLLFLAWTFGLPLLASLHQPFRPHIHKPTYLLQPNIDPYAKFNEFPPDSQLKILLALFPDTLPPGSLVIGPETALPVAISIDQWQEDPWLRPFLEKARRFQANILLGIVGYKLFPPYQAPPDASMLPSGQASQSYNAAILIRPDTAFVHIKSRLVPFVERTPYLEYLRFLRGWEIDLGGGFGSFGKPLTPPTPLPLYPDNTPVTVGVCYESIFTHDLRQRKGYLLGILTNDGWWKKSSGYYQHFSYGRLSAQSLGLPMARSANTGISAFIWPDGTVKALLPYDTRGLLYAEVPVGESQSLYAIYDEWGAFGVCTFALLLWTAWWFLVGRWKTSSEK
jgi:apolipoprotein N-acyltransferase